MLTTDDVDVEAARTLPSPASDHLQVVTDLVLPRPSSAPARDFDLQAHRGGLGLVTESTLEAFANALELGVTTLELDVQITEDQRGVVTHDRQVAAAKCRDTGPAFPGDPLMDAGVDGIITDYPDRLRALMAERGLRLPEAVRTPPGRSCRSSG